MSRAVEERGDDTPGSKSGFPSDPGRDRSNPVLKTRAQRVRQTPTMGNLGDLSRCN